MPETKQISVLTDVYVRDIVIDILTYYRELERPYTIYGFVSDEVVKLNNIDFIEGELGLRMINDPDQIDYQINSSGELIVIADIDADYYSINEYGELIYDDGIVEEDYYVIDGGEDDILELYLDIIDGGEDDELIIESINDNGKNKV